MSHTPHELAEEFPDYEELRHELKGNDAHFERLSERYHEINRAVHRAETNVEPTSDDHLIEMCKLRMQLKDEVYAELVKAAAG